MSVRLSFEAQATARLKSLGSNAQVSVTLDWVEELVREHLESHGGWVDLLRRSDRIVLALHPAEERAMLWLKEDVVGGQARTSGAGPGYHVAICELLDFLAQRLRVKWKVEDPTGYWETRDRGALERCMVEHLKEVVGKALPQGSVGEALWSVNFPSQRLVVEAPYAIVTPTGPWDADQAGAILDASRADDLARFFPWWGDRDAAYWHTVAQSLRWMEVIWTRYEPPRQREVREACRDAFRRARELDPSLPVPEQEMRRIDDLLKVSSQAPVPISELVHGTAGRSVPPVSTSTEDGFEGGYRLFPHRWTMAGRWSVDLPGDFTQPLPGENGTWTMAGPDTSLFLTPYGSTDPSVDTSRRAAKHMVEQLAAAATRRGEFIDVVEGLPGEGAQAVLWRASSGELLLQGAKPGKGTFALITFVTDEPETPETWSGVWCSLTAS